MGYNSESLLLGAVVVFASPLLLMILSGFGRAAGAEGAELRRELVASCAYIPTVVVLGLLGAVAFVQLRRMRVALEAHCAALPPGRPGEPAGCRVCGGAVIPRGTEVVVRCTYCQADNLVDPRVLRERAPARAREVTDYAHEVVAQARMLESAGRSKAMLWVAAVPLCTCLCGCPNLFLGYRLGLAEPEAAACEHVLVTTAEGRCVGELRSGAVTFDGAPHAGGHEPISGASGVPRVRERSTGRTGQVFGTLSSARVCGGTVRVRWDDDAPASEAPATGLCWE